MTESSTDRPHDEPRVPALWVEKLALGELLEDEARQVRARLGDTASERLSALARSDEQILREHPPSRVAAQIERRLESLGPASSARSLGWMTWVPAAAAAGLALMWWIGREDPSAEGSSPGTDEPVTIARVEPPAPAPTPTPEQIILKGDPVLMIDRVRAGRTQRMTAGTRVDAGDLLQLTYNAKGASQGVVVSVDGAGVATLHFPESPADPPRLAHGGPIPLAHGYELDDAPEFERFVFVTVDDPDATLDVARVMDAARDLARRDDARDGPLALPEGWRQQSLLLLK